MEGVWEAMPEITLNEIIGDSGLRQSGGFLREEFHPRLMGALAARVYRQMTDNSATAAAFLNAQEMLIRQVPWKVKPKDKTDDHRQWADFAESCREDMEQTWDSLISEIMTMAPYGWAFFELIFKVRRGDDPPVSNAEDRPFFVSKYDDGMVGIQNLAPRAQESLSRWAFDSRGRPIGMYQYREFPTIEEVLIPFTKGALFRTHSRKNNPEGRSQLRAGVRSDYFISRIEEIEAIGIERDLAGLPKVEVPVEVMEERGEKYQEAVDVATGLRRGEYEGLVVVTEKDTEGNPTGWKTSLMSTGGQRQIDTVRVISRHQINFLIAVLYETALLGMKDHGSFALADTKTGLFAMALGAILRAIKDVLNEQVMPKLMRINNVPRELWPVFTHGDIEKADLTHLANFIAQLAPLGAITVDDSLRNYLREHADLPPEDGTGDPVAQVESAQAETEEEPPVAIRLRDRAGKLRTIKKKKKKRRAA